MHSAGKHLNSTGSGGFYATLPAFIAGLRRLGEQERVAALLEVCERALGAGVLMNLNSIQCAAGTTAVAARDRPRAERHFVEALAFAERTPHVPAQAEVRYEHALTLVTQGLEQDRDQRAFARRDGGTVSVSGREKDPILLREHRHVS